MTDSNIETTKLLTSALDKASLPKDMILYRGTSTEALGDLKNLAPDDLVGEMIIEKAFMSTSTNSSVASSTFSGNMQMMIEAPAGSKGMNISSISQYSKEAEVLFQSGRKMIITKAQKPYGTWSDDTSLLLCLIQNIVNGYSLVELSKLFIEYYKSGYLTPYGEVFDIGNATQAAIDKMINGVKPENCGGYSEQDNGNGSLMRILPLAYYIINMSPAKQIEIIEEVSSLTHRHKRAKLACILYTEIAIYLLKGYSKEDAYKKAIDFTKENCSEDYKDELITYRRILSGDILHCDVNNIKSSGYVVDTLEVVIWSFITSENYTDTILKAINLGGDTDTIAAITGGIAGIFYGFSEIPDNWIQYLSRKTEIYEMLIKFAEVLNN